MTNRPRTIFDLMDAVKGKTTKNKNDLSSPTSSKTYTKPKKMPSGV